MRNVIESLIFVLFLSLVVASPVPKPHREPPTGKAYINCRDKILVRSLEKIDIPYSCLPGTAVHAVSNSITEDFSDNSVFNYEDKVEPMMEEDTVSEFSSSRCSGSERCDSTSDSSNKCKDGHVFSPKKNKCVSEKLSSVTYDGTVAEKSKDTEEILPVLKTGEIVPLIEKEKISPGVEKEVVVGEEEVIPLGKNKEGLSEAEEIVPIADNEEIIKKVECETGTIFVPEVDLCLPVDPRETIERPKVESVEIAFVPNGKCPPGTVYSPEVDHCLKVNHHSSSDHTAEEIERLFILSETNPEALVYEDDKKRQKRSGVVKERQERQVPIDESLVVEESSLFGDIGASTCKDNEVYVAEIDLCLEP